MIREFAPAEFREEFIEIIAAGFCRPGHHSMLGGMPDLTRREMAEAQIGREARGREPVGPLAVRRIAVEAVFQEMFERGMTAGFARGPGRAQAARPVGSLRF